MNITRIVVTTDDGSEYEVVRNTYRGWTIKHWRSADDIGYAQKYFVTAQDAVVWLADDQIEFNYD